jgi:hypothetical protein
MNDLESRLRDGLESIADSMEPDIDPLAALAAGERLRRARTTGWVTVGVVLATLFGLFAWTALPGRPITGIPAPAAPTTAEAPITAMCSLSFADNRPQPTYRSVDFSVERVGNKLTIDIVALRSDGGPRSLNRYLEVTAGVFWSANIGPDLVVALVPDRAEIAQLPNWHSQSLGLVGVGATAVALQREPGLAFDGLVWLGSDGIVRDSHHIVVPSALLKVGSTERVVYRDERVGVWGYFYGAGDGNGAAMPLAAEPVRTLPVHSAGDGTLASSIGFLPVGGRDPELTTRAGVEWTSGELGESGRFAFLAVGIADGGKPLVTSVTYTDQTGKRLTYQL